MHKIYFDNRSIVICRPEDEIPVTGGTKVIATGSEEDIIKSVEEFKSCESRSSLVIESDGTEEVYRRVCSAFKEVNAAGGLVTDDEGKYLLIRRNGLWDLPKGHQEQGEDIMTTAVREVEEETGARDLVPGKLLCITDHCYYRDGICHLKHTWWYHMSCSTSWKPEPQTEEGISEIVFADRESLGGMLKCTYPSILDVFEAALRKS